MRDQNKLLPILVLGTLAIAYFTAAPQPAASQQQGPVPVRPPADSSSTQGKGAPASSAGAAQKSPLVLSTWDPIVLTVDAWNPDKSIAELSVGNSSKTDVTLTYALGEMGLIFNPSGAVASADAIDLSGQKDHLASGETEHLVLRWKKENLVQPGSYQGFLTISPAKNEPVRATVRVVVPDPLGSIQPLVSKLNLRAYRWVPFLPWWTMPGNLNRGIPLRHPISAERTGLGQGQLAGAVSRDLAGTATMEWDRNAETLAGPEPVLGLSVKSIPFAGKYDGTLSFGKDPAASVSVSLTASDLFIWPLAWVCLCICLATVAKNWLSEGRQLTLLKRRIDTTRLRMEHAEKLFEDAVPEPSHGYSLEKAFAEKCDAIQDQIATLEFNWTGSLDMNSPAYTAVDTTITVLESLPKAWIDFGNALIALRNSLEGLGTAPPPPPGLDSALAIVRGANRLLEPAPLSVEQISRKQALVEAQAAFLGSWRFLWDAIDRVHSGVINFAQEQAQFVAAHADDFAKLRNQVDVARARVWMLDGSNSSANDNASAAVSGAEEQFSAWLESAPPHVGKSLAEGITAEIERVKMQQTGHGKLPKPFAGIAGDLQRLTATLAANDQGVGVLSLVLATLTGLNQLYFGKPFGTLSDYVTLTLWAFGSKVAVDVLSGGLDRWIGSKSSPSSAVS